MQTSHSHFPDLQTLTLGLTCVFRREGSPGGPVTVLHREPAIYLSSSPSEVVRCRCGQGSELVLFCKYAAGRRRHAHGHRGGVAYEAEVYRLVLQPLPALTPRFYGTHTDATGETWLVLEYLAHSERVSTDPAAMGLAAGWLGQFHAANEARLAGCALSFLSTYDAEYYRGWARRTSRFAGPLHSRFGWLAPLCERFEEAGASLLAPPPTVIHGEYTVHNVLVRGGRIYPVDWEATAIAIGEIDLATLTDRWPAAIVQECEREYRAARWPEGAPPDFERRLDLARLYVQFRWLGERPAWTTDEQRLWRFEAARCAGERLGLI
jgi:hypothetical protein